MGVCIRACLLTLLMLATLPATAGDQRARTNYMLHCSGCHLSDGSGNPANGIPNMKGSVGHFLRLEEGRHFLIQVPGTSQSPMNDADTAELLNWMVKTLSAAEMPDDFKAYTASEVRQYRASPLADPAGVRGEIVRQLGILGFRVD